MLPGILPMPLDAANGSKLGYVELITPAMTVYVVWWVVHVAWLVSHVEHHGTPTLLDPATHTRECC